MFFGAGNFIFPPMVGKNAGTNLYTSMMAFCATSIVLPVLAIAAVAKSGSLEQLVSRAGKFFAPVFIMLLYLSIGPFLGIPRAANMPYEVSISPFLGDNYLVVYTAIYFILNYLVCMNKVKMIETIGKFISPAMLILLTIFFAFGFLSLDSQLGAPNQEYAEHPVASGLIDGYQTMDAMAAFVFGAITLSAMRSLGLHGANSLANTTIKAGIFSGTILMLIYIVLAFTGASVANLFPDTTNGASLLSSFAKLSFGNAGSTILGIIFLLACFTTTVGLLSSVSEYFSQFNKRLTYKFWAIVWSVVSFAVANLGLDTIISYSIPILTTLYPIAIVLISLSLIDKFISGSKLIYISTTYTALFISLLYSFDQYKILSIEKLQKLPFYNVGLGWVLPCIICFCITYIIMIFRKK